MHLILDEAKRLARVVNGAGREQTIFQMTGTPNVSVCGAQFETAKVLEVLRTALPVAIQSGSFGAGEPISAPVLYEDRDTGTSMLDLAAIRFLKLERAEDRQGDDGFLRTHCRMHIHAGGSPDFVRTSPEKSEATIAGIVEAARLAGYVIVEAAGKEKPDLCVINPWPVATASLSGSGNSLLLFYGRDKEAIESGRESAEAAIQAIFKAKRGW